MFTGIVEELGALLSSQPYDAPVEPAGQVEGAGRGSAGLRLVFRAAVVLEETSIGDSICVNGCCLTVVDRGDDWWAADAVAETLARTSIGRLGPGDPVNLERALSVGSRLGGHLVQGHVDGIGHVRRAAPELSVETPPGLARYMVEKGSVTVEGVSLTIVAVDDRGFSVAVIPHTMAVTTLGRKNAGDPVNLEVDVIAKYAERLLQSGAVTPYSVLGAPEGG